MTAKEILEEMKPLGRESYKKLLFKNHGVKEPCFGVPIGDLKKFQKRIKSDYQLALDLYDTGNYDAMNLAGLIADDARMTKNDLRRWAKKGLRRVRRSQRAVGSGRQRDVHDLGEAHFEEGCDVFSLRANSKSALRNVS